MQSETNANTNAFEDDRPILLHKESAARKRWIRSDGALFFAIIGVFLVLYAAMNVISNAANIPVQSLLPVVCILLLALAYFVYRNHILSYEYMLTSHQFAVSRVIGKRKPAAAQIPLGNILDIVPYAQLTEKKVKTTNAAACKKSESTAVVYRQNGRTCIVLISPSPELRDLLMKHCPAKSE